MFHRLDAFRRVADQFSSPSFAILMIYLHCYYYEYYAHNVDDCNGRLYILLTGCSRRVVANNVSHTRMQYIYIYIYIYCAWLASPIHILIIYTLVYCFIAHNHVMDILGSLPWQSLWWLPWLLDARWSPTRRRSPVGLYGKNNISWESVKEFVWTGELPALTDVSPSISRESREFVDDTVIGVELGHGDVMYSREISLLRTVSSWTRSFIGDQQWTDRMIDEASMQHEHPYALHSTCSCVASCACAECDCLSHVVVCNRILLRAYCIRWTHSIASTRWRHAVHCAGRASRKW